MYISIRDAVLWHGGYATLAEALKELGVNAIELHWGRDRSVASLTEPKGTQVVLDSPDAAKSYRQHLEQHGFSGSALCLATDFGQDNLQAEIDWVASALRAAHWLGMTAIRVDAHMRGEKELPLEQRVGRYVEGIRGVIKATADVPVAMGVENHGFQGNDPKWLDGLFEQVDSPRFGMTIDTGNFYWWGHPLNRVYEILEHLAARCKHTHCKNIAYPDEVRNEQREMGWKYGEYVSPIPDGDINHRRVAEILRKGGYDGDLCIEDESMGHYDPQQWREVLKRDVAHFREILKSLA